MLKILAEKFIADVRGIFSPFTGKHVKCRREKNLTTQRIRARAPDQDATARANLKPLCVEGEPAEGQQKSTVRHGLGYSIFHSSYRGIESEATYFIPEGQAFEYWSVKVTNTTDQPRTISVFSYAELPPRLRVEPLGHIAIGATGEAAA